LNILITDGAVYIGSHVAKQLLETTTYNISILDNLLTGSIKTLNTLKTILHFPACIVVPASVKNSLKYYMNNTVNTTNLIKCAVENSVKKFIFSSAVAVYAEAFDLPEYEITENYPTNLINPCGMEKCY